MSYHNMKHVLLQCLKQYARAWFGNWTHFDFQNVCLMVVLSATPFKRIIQSGMRNLCFPYVIVVVIVWHDYDGKISIFQQDLLWNESKMRTMRKSNSSSYLIPYLIHKFTFSIHNLEMEFCFNADVCDYVVYNVICHFNTYSVLFGAFWQTQNVPYSCYQGRKKKNNNIRTFQLFDSVVWKSENISINYGIITIRFVCNGHSGLVFVHFDAKMCHMTIDVLIESGK